MTRITKLLWVKFGWSDYYRGGPVDGNFSFFNVQRGTKATRPGHEAFNFMPAPNGTYHCYVPPMAGKYAPWRASNTGWTVVCLAKHPKHTGIHVVGWYENATLIGHWKSVHRSATPTRASNWLYCIFSKSAFFVPPEFRNVPFSDPSIGQATYSFLVGPDVESDANKKRVLKTIKGKLQILRRVAIQNPDQSSAPDPEANAVDPLSAFGTPDIRKKVEEAAECAVIEYYKSKGFSESRVAELNLGYDYEFSKGSTVHYVEVKGTSMPDESFFITRNENNRRQDPRWRLGMVTQALSNRPKVKIYTNQTFEKSFDLEPLVFVGKRFFEPKDA